MKKKNLILCAAVILNASLSLAGPVNGQDTFGIDEGYIDRESGLPTSTNAGNISNVDFASDNIVRFTLDSNQVYYVYFLNHAAAAAFKTGIESMPGQYRVIIPASKAKSATHETHWDLNDRYDYSFSKGEAPYWYTSVKDLTTGQEMAVGEFIEKSQKYLKRQKQLETGSYGFHLINYFSDRLNHRGTFADPRVSGRTSKAGTQTVGSTQGSPDKPAEGAALQ